MKKIIINIIFTVLIIILIRILFYKILYYIIDNKNKKEYINKPKKRIALCISGQVRNFEYNYLLLKKNVLDYLQPDIFCYMDGNESDETKFKFTKLYKPKDIIWCNKTFENTKITPNSEKMFYRIFKCNELKKKYELKQKYDVVIRIRPDTIFSYTLPYDIIKKASETKKTVFIPKRYIINPFNTNKAVTDIIALGDSDSMDAYSNLYNNIKNYNNICTVPEYILKIHLNKSKINIKLFNYDYFLDKSLIERMSHPYEKMIKNKYYNCLFMYT